MSLLFPSEGEFFLSLVFLLLLFLFKSSFSESKPEDESEPEESGWACCCGGAWKLTGEKEQVFNEEHCTILLLLTVTHSFLSGIRPRTH
jgi:hypothetical protein